MTKTVILKYEELQDKEEYSDIPKTNNIRVFIEQIGFSKDKGRNFGVHILCRSESKFKQQKYRFFYSYFKSRKEQRQIWKQLNSIEKLPALVRLELWKSPKNNIYKISKIAIENE